MTFTYQQLFDSLAPASTDLVSVHGEDGVAVLVSPGPNDVLGPTASTLLDKPMWELAVEDDADSLKAEFLSSKSQGATRYVSWRCVGDGTSAKLRNIRTRIMRVSCESGEPIHLLCISQLAPTRESDATAHTGGYLDPSALIERAAYGIYQSSAEGRFLNVNQALVRMLGYDSAEQLRALDLTADVYADPSERELLVRRAREGRLGGWTHTRWKTRDGSIITVRVVVNAIGDEAGEIRMFEGIVEDVTESLRREGILRRNERMASLGTMLAGVAHELNNPLAAISGFAQIILRGETLSEDDRGAVETINHEANRAARIVRDLQTFARERSYSDREQVDLNDVVAYVLASQRYKMDTHGVHRDVALAPALPLVRAERAHLEQVLLNLLANASQAIEAMVDAPAKSANGEPPKLTPMISVRTDLRDGDVVLEVQDNGPGISAENLPRIFDPFFTTRPEGEGTGLGLAVVHGIVNSYSGNIEVESKPGHGTLFRVTLPVGSVGTSEEDEAPSEALIPPTPKAERALEILVVEDEIAIRRLLARYFEGRGHAVTTAENGTAALRAAEQSAFDVVVCDLRLPGIDGFEVIRRIRELPTGKSSRCILMSGANAKSPTGPLKEVLRLAAIIEKPFEIEQLRRAVEVGSAAA